MFLERQIPPIKVVSFHLIDTQESINMTLDAIYNWWLSLQPLTEAEQNMLSMRFTVEYNYITYAYTRLGTAMAALRG